MHVYLIRHAQSENNALTEDATGRRKVDPDLTELGYQQRDLLAEFLSSADYEIKHLYTSAMYRSLLTAQPLGDALDIKPKIWLDLHENGGMFQHRNGHTSGFHGMTRAAIKEAFPGFTMPDEISEKGWYDAEMGQEPETHSLFRAIKVAKALRKRSHSDDVIALVSHAGFLDVLLKAIFDQLPSRPHTMRYVHDNTAITRVNFDGARPTLHFMNRVEHLPAGLRSY